MIDMEISETVFYTDSKVVLGYICNESRRFHVYVANRVHTIRKTSSPDQWKYVESSISPADLATRGLHPKDLAVSRWLSGPEFLRNSSEITTPGTEQAVLSPNDPKVRKELKPLTTSAKSSGSPTLGTERFKRYSSSPSLRRAFGILIAKAKSLKERNTSDKPSQNVRYQHQSPEVIDRATKAIIKAAQREAFKEEFEVIAQSSSENNGSRNEAKSRKKSLKKSTLY